ncbi:hypothetical protein AAFF_G00214070 [Aldrovandia affinis]|uniref:Uncharacterized protein n=1 Tax=Aldrovandia affinis TaxID=143900 RepID=A0AAD7RGW2_9TELE|nr:hypothetical protein AAFF_G00214070 [Aldrovandia affinis]
MLTQEPGFRNDLLSTATAGLKAWPPSVLLRLGFVRDVGHDAPADPTGARRTRTEQISGWSTACGSGSAMEGDAGANQSLFICAALRVQNR